jgi:LacI family transcriptional regulator
MTDRGTDTHATPPHDTNQERPTLKTIAAATGLAIATVSRALKDAPDIGEETKRRVREMAKTVGYLPNRAGVRLRTGKTNVIALVLSTEADVMSHTAQMIYSMAAALRGTAYHLVVMPYFGDQDPLVPIRYIVETGSADGVVVNQIMPEDPRLRYMSERGFPFVAHGRSNMGIDHPYFDFDNEVFARIGVRALVERTRKHLLLIAPPREHSYSGHMLTGFADEAALRDATFEIIEGVNSDSPSDQIEQAVYRRLTAARRPDGMIAGSTTAAMAAINGAERAGLKIGRDFDLVAKEAISFLRRFRPEILVVREDVARAGDFLARALMDAIERQTPLMSQFLDQPDQVEAGETRKGGS